MSYKLHCFAQSGNAYKVALMLELCELEWQPVFVDFFNGETRKPEYLATNAMAEVPTLDDGETRLSQSAVILDYLSSKHGKFGGRSADERREILRWMFWDNHKLTGNLAAGRFMQLFLPEKHRNQDVINFLLGRVTTAMKILEQHLNGRNWIAADVMTIADISCVGYMYFLEEIAFDMTDFPNVDAWRNRIKALPEWAHPHDLMPGHPLKGAA